MQFEVPQFIEVEDKIFGPLTWRQFVYLGGGVGMAVVLFFMAPFIVFAIFGIPLALLAFALAFYPVNNRPFSYFLEAFVSYVTRPRRYHWRKEQTYIHTEADNMVVGMTSEAPRVRAANKDISSLARKLELEAIQKQT
jgi:hypothetical protein